MIVLGLMVGTSLAAMVGMPTAKLADTRPAIDLEKAVPRQFGDWRIDPSITPLPPSPDQEANLRRTYDQILSRAYVNGRGTRIMLSLTYGAKQTQQLRAHRQEVCYAAQGFKITRLEHTTHRVGGVDIPVTRMVATQGSRVEPVMYWFTTGDTVVLTYLQREMAQFKYALSGFIPDGYLVRVSSLSSDPVDAYAQQLEFANALLDQVDASLRRRLLGHS
jgi:EpsI family protein